MKGSPWTFERLQGGGFCADWTCAVCDHRCCYGSQTCPACGEGTRPSGYEAARDAFLIGEEAGRRLETGVVQDRDDWPGVFIRGDDALGFAAALREAAKGLTSPLRRAEVEALAGLLESCNVREEPRVQQIRREPDERREGS